MKQFIWVLLLVSSSTFSATEKYTPEYIQAHARITANSFFDYLRRLGIAEADVAEAHGKRWLSVGEGLSDFTSQAAKRGVDAYSLDAVVNNPHAPERSTIGLAQSLPFADGHFQRVVSVHLVDLFFDPQHFNDPATGKKALEEMLRVTAPGGDIRISPIPRFGFTHYLDQQVEQGKITYQVLPYYEGKFKLVGKKREFHLQPVAGHTPGSVQIVRLK